MLTLKGLGVKEISDRLLVGKTFVKKVRLFYQQTGSVAYDETNNRGKSRSLTGNNLYLSYQLIYASYTG